MSMLVNSSEKLQTSEFSGLVVENLSTWREYEYIEKLVITAVLLQEQGNRGAFQIPILATSDKMMVHVSQ